LGYRVYHTWECQFDNLKKENSDVSEFCSNLGFIVDSRYVISERKILEETKIGSMFGMTEVDTETPDDLKTIFAEYQPIQKMY